MRIIKTITTTLICLFSIYGFSQIFHEAYNLENSINVTNITNIKNTGADYINDGTSYCKIMVFDGSTPQFYWSCNTGSGIDNFFQELLDPDVVITNDSYYALVCYQALSDGGIYLSVWQNVNGVFNEIIGNFGQYNFPHFIETGSNPNIDIGFNDDFVITWANEDEIKAIAGYYLGGAIYLSPINAVIYQETDAWTPDVTVCGGNITFSYIRRNEKNNHEWVTLETSYGDVFNSNVTGKIIVIKESDPNQSGSFGRPRIASPPLYPNYPLTDYTTVVDYHSKDFDVGLWEILAFQKNDTDYSPSPFLYNNNFTNVPNYEPVVAYIGDMGVVCWTAEIQYPNTAYASLDVIAQYFVTSGSLGAPLGTNYSVVNLNYTNDQNIPSVAGRRWNTGEGLYLWNDNCANIMYRTSYQGTMNMRLANFANEDPVISDDNENFNFLHENDYLKVSWEDTSFDLYIYDINGRLILQRKAHSELAINLSNIPKGVYILLCHNNIERKIHKFIK